VHDRATLREFIFLSVLPALRKVELPLAAHAYAALDTDTTDWEKVGELCVLSHALKSAREARTATENIGRQRAELAAALHEHPLAREYLKRAVAGGWPFSSAISAALEGRVIGAPRDAVLAGVMYAAIAGLLAASMKIMRIGQNASQSLLTEALAEAPGIIAAALVVPIDEIGWFNPWLDIAAARHETVDGRMFIS
jgi:urease accessory protein